MQSKYAQVSGIVFGVVAALQITRIIARLARADRTHRCAALVFVYSRNRYRLPVHLGV